MRMEEDGKGYWLTPFAVLSAEAFPKSSVIGRSLVTSTMNNRCLLGKIRGFQQL